MYKMLGWEGIRLRRRRVRRDLGQCCASGGRSRGRARIVAAERRGEKQEEDRGAAHAALLDGIPSV